MGKTTKVVYKLAQQKLWTKNFTIITIGSAISMLGNMVAGMGEY